MQPILFLLLAVSTHSVVVEVDTTFKCPLSHWCWKASFIEIDTFIDDTLNKPIWECSTKPSETRTYGGKQNGDGWFNNYLDLGFKIFHNCTSFGNNEIVVREYDTPQFASVSIKEKYAKFEQEVKLLNRGKTPNYPPPIEVHD